MFEKIKTYQHHPFVKQFRDVRALGMGVFAVLALLVSWSGVKVIQTNYEFQKDIAKLQQQTAVLKLQNDNQRLKNQYYTTDQFLELAARRQFGKAAPGEKLIMVPSRVALKYTVDLPTASAVQRTKTVAIQAQRSAYQRNFEAWMNFFWHRGTVE